MSHLLKLKKQSCLSLSLAVSLFAAGCGGGGVTGAPNNTNVVAAPVVVTPAAPGPTGVVPTMQMNLPVSLDDVTVVYKTADFGGDASSIVIDPAAGAANGNVVKIVRGAPGAPSQTYAGTTLTDTVGGVQLGFSSKVPFTVSGTRMSIDFYSPAAGVHVRLKAEDHTNSGVSVETEAVTTKANAWETLTFEFIQNAAGTAALDLTKSYDKVTVFPNFNVADSGAIYYFDNVKFVNATTASAPSVQMKLPLTFDDAATIYSTVDFGGDASAVATDPVTGGTRANVVKIIRGAAGTPSATYAGTTFTQKVGTVQLGFSQKVPFTSTGTQMSIDIYSPAAGLPVRLKAEDHTDPTITVETEAVTTVANAWQTLTFEFATQAPGTAALNVSKNYDLVTVFPNFNTPDSGAIYYVDNLKFVNATTAPAPNPNPNPTPTPTPGGFVNVTFDDSAVTYTMTTFGGTSASVVADPAGGGNKVGSLTKPTTAEQWAGDTVSTMANFAVGKIPFSSTQKTMTIRVYSPASGVRYRLKVENSANPGITCETDAFSSVAGAWETLTFNFATPGTSPPVGGGPTAALDVNQTYDKVSIFADFGLGNGGYGTMPADRTYYFDDITF
jgi:hypothetical protein